MAGARIDPTARIIVDAGRGNATGRVELGNGVYLGRFVEIATTEDGLFTIGADTSIQDYAVMIGDIRIGAHCIFAPNVHVASHNHHFRDNPPWLIRDQDKEFAERKTAPVIIEDDCWIGRNAVILPGVYIGRGAVIGANCVVSRDVPPYEVHGGAPNQRIAERLRFLPPDKLDPMDDFCLPYFYRGFVSGQRYLADSRKGGAIEARGEACFVMAAAAPATLRVVGVRLDGGVDLALAFRVNGADAGMRRIADHDFAVEVEIPAGPPVGIPSPLRAHTVVEITCEPSNARYGVKAALLQR
jgi:acetyltransferase-like isoleucine patch superfamily enzyme